MCWMLNTDSESGCDAIRCTRLSLKHTAHCTLHMHSLNSEFMEEMKNAKTKTQSKWGRYQLET